MSCACMGGQSSSQGGVQITSGTVFKSTAGMFLRIQSNIERSKTLSFLNLVSDYLNPSPKLNFQS